MPSAAQSDPLLTRQVIHALLLPAARIALSLGVPVKELAEQIELACFHEARRQGWKTREAAEHMGTSLRKVADLSRRLKQSFLQAEGDYELPRRIEFLLQAGPESEPRIRQALPGIEPDAIARALELLVDQGRIACIEGRTPRYEARKAERRLVADSLLARLDALGNLAGNLGNAVYGRFFRDEPWAFARTLQFHIRPEDLPRLRALYEEQIWPALRALDEAAKGSPDTRALDFSVLWAPHEEEPKTEGVE